MNVNLGAKRGQSCRDVRIETRPFARDVDELLMKWLERECWAGVAYCAASLVGLVMFVAWALGAFQ